MLIQNYLFHRVLGELKVLQLIQNFLFHRVLGGVKIGIDPELFVSLLTGLGEGIRVGRGKMPMRGKRPMPLNTLIA